MKITNATAQAAERAVNQFGKAARRLLDRLREAQLLAVDIWATPSVCNARLRLARAADALATAAEQANMDATPAYKLAKELGRVPDETSSEALAECLLASDLLPRRLSARVRAESAEQRRIPSSKVIGRRTEILRALPSSASGKALKTNVELKEKLTSSYVHAWDPATISRDLKALRKQGLVHRTRLQRTADGDAVAAKS